MTVPNNPSRDEILAGYRALLDFLAEHPDVPIGRGELNVFSILAADDEAGMAELRQIAAALAVEITYNDRRTHWYARRNFGPVRYQAHYVTKQEMAEYDERQRYARERAEQLRSESGEVSGE